MKSCEGARWPGHLHQPKPRIPATAEQRVTSRDEARRKTSSEFWFRGALVGRASWNPDGTPYVAVGLRQSVPVGHRMDYHDDRTIYAEPHVDGVVHGLAKQYHPDGRLLIVSPFRNGTGIDYWCDLNGLLAEERPIHAGRPSGVERWWDEDQRTVHTETHWLEGKWHGVRRQWAEGRLLPGFPEFFLLGKKVAKRTYLRKAKLERDVPTYCTEEDAPERELPDAFLRLQQRARKLNQRR